MENVLFGVFETGEGLKPEVIKCDQNTQTWIISELKAQLENFLDSVQEEKPFDPHAITHSDEIYCIENFPDKETIQKTITDNTDTFTVFEGNNFIYRKPKAIGAVVTHNRAKYVCLQLFTQKNVLSRKGVLSLDQSSLKKNEDYLISIDGRLTAIFVEQTLKFRSFHAVKQIFNLKEFYVELSNDQIEQVVNGLNNFTFQDRVATLNQITQKARKLFSALSADDYIKTASASKLKEKVKKDTDIELNIEKGMVCLPKDPQTLFIVLNSMLGNIFEDERTQESHIATSKEKFVKA